MEDSQKLIVLGSNIKKIRKRLKLTQIHVEVMAGLGSGDLSRIENGLVNITFTKLAKIAETLQVSLNDLYEVEK